MPRLLVIQATGYRYRGLRVPYKLRKRKLVGGVIPYLAALAPRDWQVTLVDDATEEVDFNAEVDAVAITIRTVTSLRGYEIAENFRPRGIPVLMGGPHATFYAEEVPQHADAVCIGEVEEIFAKMLEDAAAGWLRRFYRRERPAGLEGMPTPRWDLLNPGKYVFNRPFVIQYSRGCPYTCDFCAERRLNGDYGYRHRPAAEVVEEIKKCGSKHIFFAASQFAGDIESAMELMEALIPLKIRWSTLFSAHYCLDDEFMDLARRSGLLHVNTGIESINQHTLKAMHKGFLFGVGPVQPLEIAGKLLYKTGFGGLKTAFSTPKITFKGIRRLKANRSFPPRYAWHIAGYVSPKYGKRLVELGLTAGIGQGLFGPQLKRIGRGLLLRKVFSGGSPNGRRWKGIAKNPPHPALSPPGERENISRYKRISLPLQGGGLGWG